MLSTVLSLLLLMLSLSCSVQGFVVRPSKISSDSLSISLPIQQLSSSTAATTTASSSCLRLSNKPNPEYSRQVLLREEAESPFRKVRFFLYASLGGGALISLVVSGTRVLAGLNGINVDLLPESLNNVAVDLGGIVVLSFLYKKDLEAQDSRLKRAAKGADLARLLIRGSQKLKNPLIEGPEDDFSFTTSLASLRRGRGIEKRVVIAAAGPDKIAEILREAKRLEASLVSSDLIIVPVIASTGSAPTEAAAESLPICVALPVGNGWKEMVADEAAEAASQGVDMEDGFTVVLKKNGRVGQRTKGIFLNQMVGEVEQRQAMGLDVKNI